MKSTLFLFSACIVAARLALAADYTPVTREGSTYTTASVQTLTASTNVTSAKFTVTPQSVTATNGAVVTPTSSIVKLTASGQDDGYTNTVTLAPATDGLRVTLVVLAASSNLVAIADTGNVKLSGAAELGDDDVLELIGVGTNWHEVSKSAN